MSEKLNEDEKLQAMLGQRLGSLVTRLASQNLQAMWDFDHLGEDGLDVNGRTLVSADVVVQSDGDRR